MEMSGRGLYDLLARGPKQRNSFWMMQEVWYKKDGIRVISLSGNCLQLWEEKGCGFRHLVDGGKDFGLEEECEGNTLDDLMMDEVVLQWI